MIRLTKLTDYGFVVLSRFATFGAGVQTARDLATQTNLPLPTVSKLLKMLARHGLLVAHRGMKGGYHLARSAEEITVPQIIAALDGPVAMTECLGHEASNCTIECSCLLKPHWIRINGAIQAALSQITLAELSQPAFSQKHDHQPVLVEEKL